MKNPNYINQSLTLPSSPNVTINNSNFFLILSIQDDEGKNIDFTKYIDIQVLHKSEPNNYVGTNLNTINCSEIMYKHTTFKSYRENTTCVVIPNMTLGGFWDEEYTNYISIKLNYCLNKTNCKNVTEIKDYLRRNMRFLLMDTIESFPNLNEIQYKKLFLRN